MLKFQSNEETNILLQHRSLWKPVKLSPSSLGQNKNVIPKWSNLYELVEKLRREFGLSKYFNYLGNGYERDAPW